jgi:hypothetical protein
VTPKIRSAVASRVSTVFFLVKSIRRCIRPSLGGGIIPAAISEQQHVRDDQTKKNWPDNSGQKPERSTIHDVTSWQTNTCHRVGFLNAPSSSTNASMLSSAS